MAWRFRRRIGGPLGTRVNISNRGLGASVGAPGARVGVGPSGRVTRSVTIPGTGVSNVQQVGQIGARPNRRRSSPLLWVGAPVLLVVCACMGFFWILSAIR